MTMKILHLISGGDTGGAKTHIYSLLKGLEEEASAMMVCFRPGPFLDGARAIGIDARLAEQKNRFDMGALSKVAELCAREQFDLIHCHGARANFNAMFLRRRIRVPMVTTLHSDWRLDFKDNLIKDMIFTPLNVFALKRFPFYIAVTERFKEMMIERGFPGDRIFVVYNGIDMERHEDYVEKDEFLARYGLSRYKDRLLFVIAARLDAVKDHRTLLEAIRTGQDALGDTHFLIAGEGADGEGLREFVRRHELEDLVSFLGQVNDPYSLFHAADVNLLTSVSESFPYALLEGAKAKVPFIASAVGGIPEMAGEAGLLFPAKDVEALRSQLVYAANHRAQMQTRGEALYDFVRARFSQKAMAESHIHIYETILKRYENDR